ncbi:MAG TPA: polymer-forming cytoskeletal protein [bacterium]
MGIRSIGAVLALALVVATPLAAWAFVFQNGDTVTAADGLSDDLYAAGQTVTVTGRIDGDVAAAGRVVTITGTVTGGILAAAQDVRITGPVGRTVRAAGQSVAIESAVKIDALAAGQEIYVRQQAHIGRDLLASGQTVYVAATVDRFARLIGDTVVVAGRVGKGLRVDARHLTIMPTAQIDGDVRYSAELPVDVRAGAVIKGKIERVARPMRREAQLLGLAVPVVFRIWEALALLLIGLVIVTVIPHRAREISTMEIRRFPYSLLVGLVVLLAFPVVCAVLTVTVIGIPLAVAIAFLLAAGVYLSQAFVAAALGKVLLVPIGRGKDLSASLHLTVAVGTVILALLFALPFGWVVRLLAVMSGWGAVCITVWRSTGGWTGITAGLRPSP